MHLFRPINSRYNENGFHRRSNNLYDRGTKSTRGIRSIRLATTHNQKQTTSNTNDEEM